MATDEVVEGKCHGCGKPVGVRLNKSQLAYYRCPWCGIEHRHHFARHSADYMRSLGAPAAPPAASPKQTAPAAAAPAPKPAAKPEEKPPAAKPARSPFQTLMD